MEPTLEQFSRESLVALQESARKLSEIASRYAEMSNSALRGTPADLRLIQELNDELESGVVDLNIRIHAHSGTLALALDVIPADEEHFDEFVELEDVDVEVQGRVSVFSRWDVVVSDTEALLVAGRAAHRRDNSEDCEEDAVLAVPDAFSALWRILGDDGRLWYSIPGIEPIRGVKFGVAPDDEDLWDQEVNLTEGMLPPPGRVLRTEWW